MELRMATDAGGAHAGAQPWPATLMEHHPVRWGEPEAERFVDAVLVHSICALALVPLSFAPVALFRWKRLHEIAGMTFFAVYPVALALGCTIGVIRIAYDGWAPKRADGFTTPVTLTFVWLGWSGLFALADAYIVRREPRMGRPLWRLARPFCILNLLTIWGAGFIFVFFGVRVTVWPNYFPVDWTWQVGSFDLVMLSYPPLFIFLAGLNLRFWIYCCLASCDPERPVLHAHHTRNNLAACAIIWNIAAGHLLTQFRISTVSCRGRMLHIAVGNLLPFVLAILVKVRLSPHPQPGKLRQFGLSSSLTAVLLRHEK